MMTENDVAQAVYTQMTKDLFLSSAGRLRHRVIAQRIAKEIMAMVEGERQMYEKRRSRTVMVQAVRRLEATGD